MCEVVSVSYCTLCDFVSGIINMRSDTKKRGVLGLQTGSSTHLCVCFHRCYMHIKCVIITELIKYREEERCSWSTKVILVQHTLMFSEM